MKKAYRNIFSLGGLPSLFFLALFAIQVGDAAAQECASDSECAEGEFCELDPLIEYCEDPEPGTEWACKNIEDMTGFCEDATGRCKDDSDCEENFTCRKSGMGMSGGCAPGQDCTEQKPVELTPEYGRCRAQPIPCEDDSDCPSPLFCDSQIIETCPVSSDGEVDCDQETAKTCNYQPVECETDDDCDSGYECVEAESEEVCTPADAEMPMDDSGEDDSGEAPQPDEACDGEDCPDPAESEPMPMPDIECTTRTVNICFPVRVDCQDDGDCQDGESCFDFSGDVDAPDVWDDDEDAMVCLPAGWVAIFNGHVRGQSSSDTNGLGANGDMIEDGESSTFSSIDEDEGDAKQATTTSSDDDDSDAEEASDSEDKNADESDDDSGGCSVATHGAGNAVPWLVLLGFAVIRRRFSRSR